MSNGEDPNPADSTPPETGGGESASPRPDEAGSGDSLGIDAEAERIEEDLRHLESDIADLGAEIAAAGAGTADSGGAAGVDAEPSVAERLAAERDEYLDQLQRLQAEFQNYKRRVDTQRQEQRDQAAADLVKELLPALDACDAAISAGHADVEPVRAALLQALERNGLSPVDQSGGEFDPNVHEAVMHEEGEGGAVVAEIMRTGYLWHGRVVRAAMVKVRG